MYVQYYTTPNLPPHMAKHWEHTHTAYKPHEVKVLKMSRRAKKQRETRKAELGWKRVNME